MKIRILFLFTLILVQQVWAQDQQLRENIPVHDPVMIKQNDTYYLFCTGRGIGMWSSKDMQHWKREKPVFAEAPAWAVEAVPGFRNNHIWAPDISYHKGTYYLYYSISAFGKNTSAIGLATNTTLNPEDKDYKWIDHGKVVESQPGRDRWNAIDPNLITDSSGTPWLSFGSFWDGLQLVKLNKDRLRVAEPREAYRTIASRKSEPTERGNNPIEAPFIIRKNKHYYLFASIDYCCKGADSDYKMIVGRSKNIEGPYVDKAGVPLAKGGGTLVLQGDQNWHGVGHNGIFSEKGKDYLVFHGYDANDNGRSRLRIEQLNWGKDGWPVPVVVVEQ
ncbi:arabinan endo-1,5-alpha-L-arabinosidase [Botryobacter ruber]|uniref:arabinan endo-1,5-alpha-L-arabinosidase n=1 Tax=Botryobacter ruber TaxID=2171629 RepID=UPI000E0BBC4A|nr:arabinan endo-1,5-alpha-L-arabinosidase [Botryobacter ruber]